MEEILTRRPEPAVAKLAVEVLVDASKDADLDRAMELLGVCFTDRVVDAVPLLRLLARAFVKRGKYGPAREVEVEIAKLESAGPKVGAS